MWVRYVLVPGLTDDVDDWRTSPRFAAGLGNVERVDVLPFHQMGKYKWEKLICRTRCPTPSRPHGLVKRTLDVSEVRA